MENLPHLPALRLGKPYESLDQVQVCDYAHQQPLATISQVNAGIVRRDLRQIHKAREALRSFRVRELMQLSAQAADLFLTGELALGDKGHKQTPEQYVTTLSSTSGLPHVMVRRNMEKIHSVLANLPSIFQGLSRGLDPDILDRGVGEQNGATVAYFAATDSLGLVMPSNSPAVNSLWVPAIALKIPVVLKPGREEPWTPYRLIQAFIQAGIPAEAFGFYPTSHEGAGVILDTCGRSLMFGDQRTVERYAANSAVQVHGPGWSKICVGEDEIEKWPEFIDTMVASIAENGGRSCINASAVFVPRYGREIAEALAARLGPVTPTAAEDPNARLAGFANPKMAEFIDASIEEGLKTTGAEDVTAKHREGSRKVELNGGVYLRPTIVYCNSLNHPLANKEFLCPFASVVEVPQAEMIEKMGPTLALTAITRDGAFIGRLMEARHIDRLNIGPIPTMKISWDQPHEGNLFEFLYKRRSIGAAEGYSAETVPAAA